MDERWPDLDEWRLALAPAGVRFDHALAQGWECIGPLMHRGPFASLGDRTLGLVPVRQPVQRVGFSRNQRKLLARNRRRFQTEVTARVDLTLAEPLYAANQHRLLGDRFDSLGVLAGRYTARGGPRLTQVNVWDGATLAAVSFMLLGEVTGYSLIGLFHPDYAAHSLGTHTMLEEVAFLRGQGGELYYPGHVMVGSDALHYKLRLQGLEALDWRRGWRPLAQVLDRGHPVQAMWQRLARVEAAFRAEGFEAARVLYPLFSLGAIVQTAQPLVRVPELVDLGPLADGGRLAVVARLPQGADQLLRMVQAPHEPWHDELAETLAKYGQPWAAQPLGPPCEHPDQLVAQVRGWA
ncbi:MAG: hypothetical protein H6702_22350 [Myxococcales bacterium]|nr:hypothetical protein [Myxococcales bacterium]